MTDQVLRTDRLSGRYVDEFDGDWPGLLCVEKRADGLWYDSERDVCLEAREMAPLFQVVGDASELRTIIQGGDEWWLRFEPTLGEVERVGIWCIS
jgi:hypothetical protein